MVYRTHGMSKTGTHKSWESMKQRCLNPNASDYHRYGGRGVTVCSRWKDSFENFLADMGERPEGKSLDRIESEKGYEPNNCKWSTPREQQLNKRSNPTIIYQGRSVAVAVLAREIGIPSSILIWRLNNCWDIDRAVNTPKFLRKGK